MTSGMRHILSETVLWLSIFIIALTAFLYLDSRIGAFMQAGGNSQSQAAVPSMSSAQDEDNLQTDSQGKAINEEQADESDEGRVVLQAGRSGHFEVKAYINDRSINLMADTGATYVVLSYADAETLGLTDDLEFSGEARTANGVTNVALVTLNSVEVGDIQIDNVKAVVAEPGKLQSSLLGMSFIGRLERFEMSGRQLVLIQ